MGCPTSEFSCRGKLVWRRGGEEGGGAASWRRGGEKDDWPSVGYPCGARTSSLVLTWPPPPTQQAHQQWRPASKIPRPHDAGQQVVTDASCHLHHKRVERVTRGHNLHHKRGSRQEELTMLSGTQEGLK